ncbi:MAG TPA: hypothetical protein VFZ09_38035 [Archangium sp.]|uniref:hypothetical protein n=1 Tax=Archangium sp. TaxID=1872627 RepID=UPI002E31188C|nr:hypothetical protein [Archangium sp.]HEX5752078.1 hypothetical protein [Archangium sp.]
MKKQWLLLAATAASLTGCYEVPSAGTQELGSFRVVVQKISPVGSLLPLDVVPSCLKANNVTRTEDVPAKVRGTKDCRYVIPNGAVELLLDITALDKTGKALDFNGPVTFKVVPGDLSDDYSYAWTTLRNGRSTGDVKVRARNVYGEVRVWAMDEPMELRYTDGGIRFYTDGGMGDPKQFPQEPDSGRTYAAGSSDTVYFQEPTLQAIQSPQGNDNRSSPFVGQFVTVGRAPESGSVQYQNCPDRDLNGDGLPDPEPAKPVTLLVTGTDPSGFFVTDITACPAREDVTSAAQVRVPEPSGYLPGAFNSVFVYNYSFPEGLDPGDLLWTLSGSIQEFTSTTQITFPSWTVREHVRELPPDQWNKYLALAPPVELTLRHCGLDNTLAPFVTDTTCGQNRRNMKLESMESGLVKLRRVRFPQVFKNCDFNGDGQVPMFCETTVDGVWTWAGCAFPPPAVDPDAEERQCSIDCTTSGGAYQNLRCSEKAQFTSFGQFVVELAGPGPREAGLDDTLSSRQQDVLVSDTSSKRLSSGYEPGVAVSIWCDVDTHVKLGDGTATATRADELLPARTRKDVIMESGKSVAAFLAAQPVATSPAPRCSVARNTHTRVLLLTKDAVPDLKVDCSEGTEATQDTDAARQCRYLHGASFDVVGHLRQVQAARPRWMVLPRDQDDLCCYPGPGLECPRPIKPCP